MFIEKLNKKSDGSVYVIEEIQQITDGKYEGLLQHDNINNKTLKVYTGPKLTGDEIINVIHSVSSDTPWKSYIKIFASVDKVYITYETPGDTVESEDINELQKYTTSTQNELDQYETSNDSEVSRLKERMKVVEETKAEEVSVAERLFTKADKVNTYTKEETDQRIQNVVAAAPEALDTLKELADSLNDDPNFAATMTNQLATKVDKVSGKGLSTEDYTTDEKSKLAGIEKNANNYIHPSSGVAAGTYRSVSVDAKGHVTEGSNPTTLAGYGINDATPSSHIGATGIAHGIVTTAVNGFMSAADKTKLDGIDTGANNYIHPTSGVSAGTYKSVTVDVDGHVIAGNNPSTLAGYGISDATPSSHIGATGTAHGAVTTSTNGFMISSDKTKLDTVATNANNYIHPASGIGAGTYRSLTVDANGHVTAGSNPTTLGSYGITDAVNKGGDSMSGFLTLNGDPTQPMHAVTKQYVDNLALGLVVKRSVRAASTTNIPVTSAAATTLTLTSALTALDGITLAVGDRILLKDQSDATQNGIYVYTKSTLLTRANDADSSIEITSGMFTFVEEGVVNDNSGWVLTTNGSITLGITALSFAQFSGAGQVIAGTGISKSGNTLSLRTSGVGAGTYTKTTVDVYGRVTSGTTLSASDIPTLDWSKISGAPTSYPANGGNADTVDGYHIKNLVKSAVMIGANLDSIVTPGFYTGENMVNAPNSGWWYIIVESHGDGGGNGWYKQTITGYGSGNTVGETYMRLLPGGTSWTPWRKVWTEFNQGSGSGLDADKLDGLHADSFLQKAGGRITGDVGVDAGKYILFGKEEAYGGADTGGDDYAYMVFDNDTDIYAIDGSSSENSCFRIGTSNDGIGAYSDCMALEPKADLFLNPQLGNVYVGSASNRKLVWNSGNDGSGSGLDADLLDGCHASVDASSGTVVVRNSAGYIMNTWFNSSRGAESTAAECYIYDTGDGYMRKKTVANVRAELGGSGRGLDADTVDGLHANQLAKSYPSDYQFGGNSNSITTAQFITMLTNLGAFNQMYWVCRGSWSYAGNQIITDTGCGNIHLAGSTIEVLGNTSTGYTIRIHTPTTGSGSNYSEFIYVNNGTDYAPGWRKIWNSANDGAGSGLDADTLDGMQPTTANNANTIVQRDSAGNIYANLTGYKNVDASNEMTLANGFAGGTLWMNYKGTTGAITELRIANGLGTGALIPVTASQFNGNLNGIASLATNADQIDGLHASSFLRSDTTTSLTNGTLYLSNPSGTNWCENLRLVPASNGWATIHFGGALGSVGTAAGQWSMHCYNGNFRISHNGSGPENGLNLTDSAITFRNNTVWHSGNDGSGSGLDADAVDGVHADRLMRNYYQGEVDISDANYKIAYATNVNGSASAPDGGWWHIIHIPHRDNNGYGAQIAISYYGKGTMYVRSSDGTSWGAWAKLMNDKDGVVVSSSVPSSPVTNTLWAW